MEVILKKDVAHLGSKDELVIVKNGYGRNYLIPHGHAILATESLKKVHQENLKQRAHKDKKMMEDALVIAKKLKAARIKVSTKVGEKGKIFGSINSIQVAESISALGFTIDRKDIVIKNEPIKQTGVYQAEVKFHKEVKETIEFEVVGE